MPNLKGVIFDFDGIIIDSETIWYNIFKEWFSKTYKYNLSIEEFMMCVGASSETLFKYLDESGIHVDRIKFTEETQNEFVNKTKNIEPLPGIKELIVNAHKMGLKIALATSSKKFKPVYHLERLGLIKYFDKLVTADDVERIKPNSDLYLKALDVLNLKSNEVIAIEDSKNGYIAATGANIKTILIPNSITKHEKFDESTLIFESANEISLSELKL